MKNIDIKTQKSNIADSDYRILFNDIKSILEKVKYKAYKAVDNLRVQAYWQIGERIVREELQHKGRADYGKNVIEKLAKDLKFIKRDIYRMLQFYKAYPIVTSLMSQLSWTHYIILVGIKTKGAREFYQDQIVRNNWSVRELERQIKLRLYERMNQHGKIIVKKQSNFALPEKIFKDSYNFDFLKLDDMRYEKKVEEVLVRNVESLLLEFGQDFSLAGRQKKIIIDNQTHFVDLEFYHRGIPCIVIVDIKIGRFKSEYVGQMNKYLNYYREKRKYDWEKDPIGLIICEDKGEEEVRFALGDLENKIFVAEYKSKLPTAREIKTKLHRSKNKESNSRH
ncbi:DUF1016 domain-containing protein [bacterium]|nr:DUF1016 domain-containing protein [bacterium]